MENPFTFQFQSEQVDKIAKALCAFQGECPAPPKDREVDYTYEGKRTKYSYSDLATVIRTCQPHLKKNGLSVTQIVLPVGDERYLLTQLIHESGQWLRSFWTLHHWKLAPQKQGSEFTYLRRYSYSAITGVASDEDDDGADATGVKKDQPEGKNQDEKKSASPPKTKEGNAPKQDKQPTEGKPPEFDYEEQLPDWDKAPSSKPDPKNETTSPVSKIDMRAIGEMVMPGGVFAGQKIKDAWNLKTKDAVAYADKVKVSVRKGEKTSQAQLMFIDYGISVDKISGGM